MMHRLRRYDVFGFVQNDVASLRAAMMQTSFKKRTFVGRQKCVFCCLKRDKRCLNKGNCEQKVSK